MAITLVGEVVNAADAVTGFNQGNISGDDDFVEGTGAIGLKISGTTQEMFTTTLGATAPYSFASGGGEDGFHIIMWFNTKIPIQGGPTNGGLRIVVGNGTDRGHWFVDPFEFYKGGFITAVVDSARAFDNIAAGTWTLGGNPAQLSNVTQMGGVGDLTATIMGNFNTFQLDQFTIGEGIRADGAGNTFEDVRIEDEETNFWGWWSSKNGSFVGKGKLYVGPATGAAASDFTAESVSVVFAAERVAQGFYEINTRGGGTNVSWSVINVSSALAPLPYEATVIGFPGSVLDVSGDDNSIQALAFHVDGTKVLYVGDQNDNIYERTLTTAWDLSSAGSSSSFDISGDSGVTRGLHFKPDGTEVYYGDNVNDNIYQRTLSTAWDITSAGASSSFSITGSIAGALGITLSPDGTRVYYAGFNAGNEEIQQRILSTAWDITSAGSVDGTLDVNSILSSGVVDLTFNEQGDKLLATEVAATDRLAQWSLSTPWDIDTATLDFVRDITELVGAPDGITWGDNGNRLYFSDGPGTASADIREFNFGPETRWNLTVQSDTNDFDDTDGVLSGFDHLNLDNSVTFLRTTLINGNRITQNGATLDGITVLDANRAIGESHILSDNPGLIDNGSFTFSEGHAIEIDTTGTYAMAGNIFTGYGPGTADDAGTHDHVDAGADTITIAGDPFVTGDPVYYSDEGGTDTIGLTDNALYYVRRTAASTYQVHENNAAAIHNVGAINLSDGSTGEAHALYSARAAIYNNSGGTVTLQISGGGTTPTIRNQSGSSTIVENNVELTFSGLKDNTEVRVYSQADPPVELAGIENAIVGTADNRSVTFSLAAGITVDVRFAHGTAADGLVYTVPPSNAFEDFVWPATTTTLPVTQVRDRTFDNP
jgi:hypothetical protein